eukprot:CAMPEP_0195523146 /NCGR_PEP_ID=MMETSP0794_2-20130614/22029_1 /TAXON_ID=515487 /ORGANISM="Stephanopyxis turris, Strain CCMP 815" /LENGTH=156 /DNA_ID=CAMNT_0040653065 /DNA_START=254 /DNA_END=724 /DNA_ORIENTATION=-
MSCSHKNIASTLVCTSVEVTDGKFCEESSCANTIFESSTLVNNGDSNDRTQALQPEEELQTPTSMDLEAIKISATTDRKRSREVSDDEYETGNAFNNRRHSKKICIAERFDPSTLIPTDESDDETGEFQDDFVGDGSDIHPELIEACDFIRSVGLA